MVEVFTSKRLNFNLPISLNKLVLLLCLLVAAYMVYERYKNHKEEQIEAAKLILNPKVGDIYFFDFRMLSDKREQKNKYKLAKVVSVTNDSVGVVYGRFYYQWQYSVVNSIQYGDLSNSDYFKILPEYFSLEQVIEMHKSEAIYLVKRPILHQLYGNYVTPQ